MTAHAGNKKFPNLSKSRCRQDTSCTNRASFCKEVLRTLQPHWKCACLESLSSVNFMFQIFNVLFWHTFAPLFSRKSKSATIEQLFYCYLYWAQIYKCGKQHWDSKTDELWSQNGGNEHTELIQPVNTCLQYPFCVPTGRKKYMLYPLLLKHKICLFLHHSGGF